MSRYEPSRLFLHAALAALAGAALSAAFAITWDLAWVPAVLFAATAAVLGWLALRRPIEVHETHLAVGPNLIPWADIRRLDTTGWMSPLVVRLTLFDDRRVLVLYPGDPNSATRLLSQLRHLARHALIDGVPYRRFWGDSPPASPLRQPLAAAPRPQVLSPEEEAEIEKLYQRLKAVGHFDSRSSSDDD
jgi:hypothetical protein